MHIGPTKLFEDNALNTKFDKDKILYTRFTDLNWDDSAKIKEAIPVRKNNEDEIKDLWEKNR